jgi:hypothetical protein
MTVLSDSASQTYLARRYFAWRFIYALGRHRPQFAQLRSERRKIPAVRPGV